MKTVNTTKLRYSINLHLSLLTCHCPELPLWTYSSTVVWSSTSVLASFSFRRLHSSTLRSSSCCSSFKPATVLLSAWFFCWWNTQILMLTFQFQYRYTHLVFYISCTKLSGFGLNWCHCFNPFDWIIKTLSFANKDPNYMEKQHIRYPCCKKKKNTWKVNSKQTTLFWIPTFFI